VRDQVAPAHAQLAAALHESCRLAGQEPGRLQVGFTATTAGACSPSAAATAWPLRAQCRSSLGDELAYATAASSFPAALQEALLPRCTPSGRPIRRFSTSSHSLTEFLPLVAAGQVVHATVEGVPLLARDDVVLIPISDMPAMPLGLIWSAAAENQEIRALAEVARSLQVEPAELP
jgi:hypothetical protein